ncbi:MAG: SurA N-terminal domain-containing protein [Myxococcales bacterium]|nr:SurA N-terminal domain-containing protein [Myxococcales bacterium]
MLEFIRRQSTSFLSWLILGGIALIFGLQFGLPSDSFTLGSDGIAKVRGTEIRDDDFRLQIMVASLFRMIPKEPELKEMMGVNEEVIDGIVERLLLTEEAEDMGLAATQKEAEDMLLDGHLMLFGQRLEWLAPDEKYSASTFNDRLLGSLRVKDLKLVEHQRQELLAQTLRDLMGASMLVPESEVRRAYDQSANTLSLRYARYEFSAFADLAEPTPAQLDAYVTEHAEELDKLYESQKEIRFTGLPKQARLWLVQTDVTPEARAGLEEARAGIAAGTERFSAAARARSSHDTAARGGDYGWVDEQSEAASDLPDDVRKAIPGLVVDAVSEIVEADGHLWLMLVSDRREGDVAKEDALRELAAEGARDELAKDLARRAAEEDQNAVAAGTPLGEVFAQAGALGETTLFGGSNIEDLPLEGETPAEGTEGGSAEGDAPKPDAPKPDGADALAGVSRPKAELKSTGPFVKGQRIPTLGDVPGLLNDAWAYAGDMELLDGIYEVPGALVLAGVEDKHEANDEEFAEQRSALYEGLREQKAERVVKAWTKQQCFEAKGKGDIKVSEATVERLTTYDTKAEEEGEDAPAKKGHTVCDRVGGGGGYLTASLRRR